MSDWAPLPSGTSLVDGHAVLGTWGDLELVDAGFSPPLLPPASPGAQASPLGLLDDAERARRVEQGGPTPDEPAVFATLRASRAPYRGEFSVDLVTDADPDLGLGLQLRTLLPVTDPSGAADPLLLAVTLDPRPGQVTVEVFTPARLAADVVTHLREHGAPADDPMLVGWATLQLIRPEKKGLSQRSASLVITKAEPGVVHLEEQRPTGLRRQRKERLDDAGARAWLEGLPAETFR